ncbi:COMM domain-containing protein 3 isoform X2 [Lasioglossum baleicum]|uniref:COMM domain-containing protein 3 isoform X2 n=1 Tax=Lasioglossum baleicum TaxID=434251 RepID=UPI003FCC47FA
MELSKDVIESFANISNVNMITDDNFLQILDAVVSHLQANPIDTSSIVKAVDSKVILTKKIFADMLCLFVKAAQHDLDKESLNNLLCQMCSNVNRRKRLCDAYIINKKTIQSRLESISSNPPHIVDVDWHLDYRVKVDTCNSLGVPLYHVQLSTKEHERINHVTFSCTIQQLQELVFKFKDAIRYSEKLTNV